MAASISTAVASAGLAGEGAAGAARRMDAMYRYQRHVYDLTRKFYLFGRDRLLHLLPAGEGATVLEMGCGTGRNLVKLAALAPRARLYGVDVSAEMLASSARTVSRHGVDSRIRLAQAAGQEFDPAASFGIERFDTIYFSYVLSMIPDWQSAVARAWAVLAPGGTLAVVDFADQSQASALRRRVLLAWLDLFDVHPRPEIQRDLIGRDTVSHREDVLGGYAYIVLLKKPALP
jgi:S-adenosylmethionine-diacylgycerolhomoserine-N-methlytransferase